MVENDGRTDGVAVPSGDSQQAMFAKAMKEAGVMGDNVGYVEAHAPGTKLGDQVESEAWGGCLKKMKASQSIPIGSLKSYIGHL